MLINCATQIEVGRVQNEAESGPERNKEEAKMELLATYGDDGEKSESPGPSSDVGEKDASPVARVPSFTPYLQAEWESFEKLIAGGGESQKDISHNAQMFAPIPPVDFSNGSNIIQEIHQRESDDNTMVNESHLHRHSPRHGSLSNSASHSTSSSRSSSLDRPTDSKKIEEVINVSRSPSKSDERRSCSTSPIAIIRESPDRNSGSDSPVHSSPSRSRSNSTGRYSQDRSPDHHRRAAKSRSRSRSRSRSHRRSRSRSRSSRHRRRKHSHKSRSRSRSRRYRRSRTPHKKNKHRRRSRSRDRHRSRDCRRSRSRDRFGRNMRGRDSYRERSPTSLRRRSRSRERSRDRESHRNAQRDYIRRESRDGGGSSSRGKDKPLNFKEQMRQELIKASKMLSESNVGNLTELMEDKKILEPSSDQPNNITLNSAVLTNLAAATQNSTVTPQVALLQTMAAMHKKAQEITGIAVPKYYNPAAVNPLKYAEQVQKRKLLWSRPSKEKKDGGPENQWQGTHFSTDQDGKMAAKFRKLMGMKSGEEEGTEKVGEERKKQQEELFSRLDKEYEFARMATHTHRGVGLGFQSQNFYQH